MVADLVHATDESLRAQARRLAARLVLDRSRSGRPVRTGTARPRLVPADRGGDLDVDASHGRDRHRPRRAAAGRPRRADRPRLGPSGPRGVPARGRLGLDERRAARGGRDGDGGLRAAGAGPARRDRVRRRRTHAAARCTGPDPAATVVDRVLALRGHGVTRLADALRAASRRAGVRPGPAPGRGAALGLPAHRRGPGRRWPGPSRSWSCSRRATTRSRRRAFAAAVGARCAELDGADSAPALLRDLL